jgi:regulator of replication initiation timing
LINDNGEWQILESVFTNLVADPAVQGVVINATNITKLRNQANEIARMNQLLEIDNEKLQVDLKNQVKARVDLKSVNFDEFEKIYTDDLVCLEYLANLKWGKGYQCKKCKKNKFSTGKSPFSRRCTTCGYVESATTGTIFYRIKFPIIKAFYLVFLVSSQRKITALQLSNLISLRKDTCASFKRRILVLLKGRKNANKLINGWESLVLSNDNSKLIN